MPPATAVTASSSKLSIYTARVRYHLQIPSPSPSSQAATPPLFLPSTSWYRPCSFTLFNRPRVVASVQPRSTFPGCLSGEESAAAGGRVRQEKRSKNVVGVCHGGSEGPPLPPFFAISAGADGEVPLHGPRLPHQHPPPWSAMQGSSAP